MAENITEILFEKGTLVDLFIGRWAGIHKMKPDDLLMEKVDSEAIYIGHKKLLPKKAMEKLLQLEGKARQVLTKRSLDFPVGGARFVYFKALPQVLKELQTIQAEWEAEVKTLLESYPQLRDQQLVLLWKQAEKIAKEELRKVPDTEKPTRQAELQAWLNEQHQQNTELYPTKEALEKKFSFRWRLFKVEGVEGLEALAPEEMEKIQQKLKEDLEIWVKDAAGSMHQALGLAAARAKEMLQKHGKLNPRNLKPLFEAIETFKATEFTGTSQYLQVINNLKKKYAMVSQDGSIDFEHTADTINDSESAKKELGDLLSMVGELAKDAVSMEAGITSLSNSDSFSRFVNLD